MKKQRKRIYTALLCTCFLFSTASVPVSAAETEQEEMITLSNRSGEAEVSTKDALTSALGDSNISKITLKQDIAISDTLTVNRAVTLDLNGFVLRMTKEGSVIKVEQGGELTIADSDTDKAHKFVQSTGGLWVLVDDSSKTVYGGIITGGNAQKGGGVYVAPGGKLNMTGGSIVGCQAKFGGGVYLDNNDQTGEPSEFTMTSSRIIGCTASDNGGGVAVNPACTFTMNNGSEIRSCTARNGGGSMQAIRAARGKTLDLSAYTPMRDGYDFGGWYADKDLTQRITEIKLSGSKTVYADWKKREPNEPDAVKNPFADVNAGDWFYQDVLFSYEKGLMSGMDAAAFAPYANTTRAQIAVIFYRMEGSPAVEGENSFTDVVRDSGTAWFYDAVTWAQQNGIMGGYSNSSFAPNDPITREQLAAIFYRYAQYKGYDTTQGGMAIREFDDYESISDYAMSAMAWAVNTGLVKGDSNLLYPKGTATRAEIAALFHRFAENGMK